MNTDVKRAFSATVTTAFGFAIIFGVLIGIMHPKFDNAKRVLGMKNKKAECTTIQSGEILSSTGDVIELGYDNWGYNYQAMLFNGYYENYSRPEVPVQESPSDTDLEMKWNDAWLSNMDCDGDGLLDRHLGYDTYEGSGAWLTNHMEGGQGKDHWTYFVKIVAVPENATSTDGVWYDAGGTEIGPKIWGEFAIVQETESGAGATYVSPAGPGFGKFK